MTTLIYAHDVAPCAYLSHSHVLSHDACVHVPCLCHDYAHVHALDYGMNCLQWYVLRSPRHLYRTVNRNFTDNYIWNVTLYSQSINYSLCFIGIKIASTLLRSYGYFPSFYWWRKSTDALPCIISGTSRHPNRTTDVL